jgi:predicted aldo/keto reductase-like oxidoreductase
MCSECRKSNKGIDVFSMEDCVPQDACPIPRRELGKTGLDASILAFGTFCTMEALPSDVHRMLDYYLDAGGNVIDTAPVYGDAERKAGSAVRRRRGGLILATKTFDRTKAGAAKSLDASLTNLQTDYADLFFVHSLENDAELQAILARNGALSAFEKAREQGKVRFIGVSGHKPEVLPEAIRSYPFDAVMQVVNYYDYFNYPLTYEQLLPCCHEKGIGVIGMKPLAGGLLHRSSGKALRWAWSLPVTTVVAGNNTMNMVKNNIRLARSFKPMTAAEKRDLYLNAPEYADYVCRRCSECLPNSLGLDIKKIFGLEGYFDRQMYTGYLDDPADFALREHLRFGCRSHDSARLAYERLRPKVPRQFDTGTMQGQCPYGIDVPRKLRIAAWKLTSDPEYLSEY